MNRRGFIGSLVSVTGAVMLPTSVTPTTPPPEVAQSPAQPQQIMYPHVEPADDSNGRFIVGISAGKCDVGDFVMVKYYGPANVKVSVT